ncbi:23S rRNA (guanosine(2251)-2'-O)-methyltransferase RlmB [bacterium]|nr:23S rRNA (guanosine(2251)-2'-O)-methyltransferase RlmB [bacterium]
MKDSQDYLDKKTFFDSIITLYGRNVVLEILEDETLTIHKIHLAKSNRDEGPIEKIREIAQKRSIEIKMHTKEQLSRISKNAKQDQGVAIDIVAPNYKKAQNLEASLGTSFRLLALDGVQNPQNLGMIVRSAAAGNIDGIILPDKNAAKISPLVIKASAGTLFKIPIFYCNRLEDALNTLQESTEIYALSSHAKEDIYSVKTGERVIFVLGNESEGVSSEVNKYCNRSLSIPMQRGVESLNVAVTAALLAFLPA